MRLGDLDALKENMMIAFDCENATKYGNKDAEQQAHSYSTLMLYEISNIVEDCIDNAPTLEFYCPYLSDEEIKQPCLQGPCERRKGEWKYTHDTFSKRICNKCNYSQVIVDGMSDNFCPNCGASMQKGSAE